MSEIWKGLRGRWDLNLVLKNNWTKENIIRCIERLLFSRCLRYVITLNSHRYYYSQFTDGELEAQISWIFSKCHNLLIRLRFEHRPLQFQHCVLSLIGNSVQRMVPGEDWVGIFSVLWNIWSKSCNIFFLSFSWWG